MCKLTMEKRWNKDVMCVGTEILLILLMVKYDIKLRYGTFSDRPYDSKAIWGMIIN